MILRPLSTLLAVVSIVLLSGCARTPLGAEPAGNELVLRRGDLVRRHLLTGELEAERAVDLVAPPVPNPPLEIRWLADQGLEVEEGDTVVEFDNSSFLSAIDERRVRLVEEQNRLASASADAAREVDQAHFDLAEKQVSLEKARLEAEVPQDLLTALEYQERQLALRRADLVFAQAKRELATKEQKGEKELRIRQVAVRKAELELEENLQGFERLALKAPRSGIFLLTENRQDERKWQVGDSAWSGQVVGRLPELESLVVQARLLDVDEGRIEDGMAAVITLDAFPDLEFPARVRKIDLLARQVSRESTRRSFEATLDLQSLDLEHMRPGMSVRALIEESLGTDLLLAPRESLEIHDGDEPRLVLADGRRLEVRLGPCNAHYCALTETMEGPSQSPAGATLDAGLRLGHAGQGPS